MNEQQQEPLSSLEQLLDRLSETAREHDHITIEVVLEVVGRRALGPLLLIPGLIALSPLSGIPGVPTIVGITVLLITGELLIGRSDFWLPQFVLRRSAPRGRVEKAIRMLRPVARVIDALLKPRLSVLVERPGVYVIAVACLLIAAFGPILELVPFAITGVGAAVSAFGLALIAGDGLLALLAFAACFATAYLAARTFLF